MHVELAGVDWFPACSAHKVVGMVHVTQCLDMFAGHRFAAGRADWGKDMLVASHVVGFARLCLETGFADGQSAACAAEAVCMPCFAHSFYVC